MANVIMTVHAMILDKSTFPCEDQIAPSSCTAKVNSWISSDKKRPERCPIRKKNQPHPCEAEHIDTIRYTQQQQQQRKCFIQSKAYNPEIVTKLYFRTKTKTFPDLATFK